jgi:uncharacterized protein YjiS (DUF1127 family)
VKEVAMSVHSLPAARERLGRGLQARAAIGWARLLRWHELARQRRALLALSDDMLKDIGITRSEAEREARRPFRRDGIDP